MFDQHTARYPSRSGRVHDVRKVPRGDAADRSLDGFLRHRCPFRIEHHSRDYRSKIEHREFRLREQNTGSCLLNHQREPIAGIYGVEWNVGTTSLENAE